MDSSASTEFRTSSSEDRRARVSPSLGHATPSTESHASCSSSFEPLMSYVQSGCSGKTSLDRYLRRVLKGRRGGLSSASSQSFQNSGMVSHGEYLTLNTSEWPSDADVCFLSDVLETQNVPERYFLSPTACQGILRRAESRGKELPSPLKETLEEVVASGEEG